MPASVTATRLRDRGVLREWELFDAIDEGFCVIEVMFDGSRAVDYRFVEVNACFERQTGLVGVVGKTMRELAPAHEEHWFEMYGRVATTGQAIRFEQGASQLGDRWYNVFAFRVGDPALNLVGVLFRDEAQRRRTELALQDSQQRLDEALLTARMASWDWDVGSDRVLTSVSFNEVFGLPHGHVLALGQIGFDLAHPDDRGRHRAMVERAIELGEGWHTEFRIIRKKDGKVAWIEEHAIKSEDPHTGQVRWTGLAWDVTQRKQAEQALRDADQRKDEFIATLGHELRNPLAPIRNVVELLRKRTDLPPGIEKLQAILERQVRHMTRLVEDLLEVSRITSGKMQLRRENVMLQSVVTAAVETAQPHLHHQFSFFMPPEPLFLHADAVRLAQVFANLLHNARKFTPPGGRITIGAQREGSCVRVMVRDEGVGIQRDDVRRIFEPFVQVGQGGGDHHGGLGIGLALARSLVQMHDGTIEAASAGPGQGSEFSVVLPLAQPGELREALPPDAGAANGQQLLGTVLIVDDKPDNVSTLAMLLALPDHQVHTASSGEEAVRKAESLRPDVILMDIGLPGMSGHEAGALVRSQPWSQQAVMLAITGWGQEEDRLKSYAAGFDEHLVKPVDSGTLLRAIETARAART